MPFLPAASVWQQAKQLLESTSLPVAFVPFPGQAKIGKMQCFILATADKALCIDASQAGNFAMFWHADRVLAAFNGKDAYQQLHQTFGRCYCRFACVRITEQLLACGHLEAEPSLSDLAKRYGLLFSENSNSLEDLKQQAKQLAKLVLLQGRLLRQQGMSQVSIIESQAVAAVGCMELMGLPFDEAMWSEIYQQSSHRLASNEQQLQRLWEDQAKQHSAWLKDPQLALGRSAQKEQALLDYLQQWLLSQKSVNEEDKQRLVAMQQYLQDNKLLRLSLQRYSLQFLEYLDDSGRLHATFEQIGASTGRMACHSPNLQALIKGTKHRKCFHTDSKRCLLMADYSACELRILAYFSQEPVFLAAFQEGLDLHAMVASRLFGQDVSKTNNKKLRDIAKVVSFGLLYGMGPKRLAETLHVSYTQAEQWLARYFQSFPRIDAYLREVVEKAFQQQSIASIAGRRLRFQALANDAKASLRQATQARLGRLARNMPIQGSNADLIKLALGRLHQQLQAYPEAFIVHCVHDEIIVECPKVQAQPLATLLCSVMRGAGESLFNNVPMEVDCEVAEDLAVLT